MPGPHPGWPGNRVQRPLDIPLLGALLFWHFGVRPSLLEPARMFWLISSREDVVTVSGTPEGDKLILFLNL